VTPLAADHRLHHRHQHEIGAFRRRGEQRAARHGGCDLDEQNRIPVTSRIE